jgi:uncharacterized membrane protein YbhN (UPF0104 family)
MAALRLPPAAQPAVPAGDSLGTIVLERALDLVAILLLSAGVGWSVLGARLPGWLMGVYAAALLALAAAAGLLLGAPGLLARLRARWAQPFWQRALDFAGQVVAGLRRLPRRPLLAAALVGESLVIWLCDGLLLWLAVRSLGHVLPLPAAVFVVQTVDMLAAVPLTPGGLGQIESAYALLLTLLAQPGIPIAAAVLATRAISYWSFLLVSGGVALAMGFGRMLTPAAVTPAASAAPDDRPA